MTNHLVPIVRILSVSGGKDSTAMYLKAIESRKPFQAVFADTGNESQETLDFVAELPKKAGGPPIQTVRADLSADVRRKREALPEKWGALGISRQEIDDAMAVLYPTGTPFLDMCMMRGGFPSYRHQFCTDILKIKPIAEQVYAPAIDDGYTVVSWQGVRRDESRKRAALKSRERRFIYGCDYICFRPLLDWSVSDVMAMHAKHGVAPNPLYQQGMNRVGCWPCIYSAKSEVRHWSNLDPAAVTRVQYWEKLVSAVSRRHTSTFFMAKDLNLGNDWHHTTHGIIQKVEWAKRDRHVSKGQENLFGEAGSRAGESWNTECATYGVCE